VSINCIIFDLGGVLFRNGTKNVISLLEKKYFISNDKLIDIFYGQNSFDFRAGKISSTEYWESIYSKYHDLKHIDLKTLWYDSYTVNVDIYRAVIELKKKYILGILSDNIRERVEYLEKRYNFSKCFNFWLYSYDTGFCKTNVQIFKVLDYYLNSLNLLREETLIIDDYHEYLLEAEKLGYTTIHYKENDDIVSKLSEFCVYV